MFTKNDNRSDLFASGKLPSLADFDYFLKAQNKYTELQLLLLDQEKEYQEILSGINETRGRGIDVEVNALLEGKELTEMDLRKLNKSAESLRRQMKVTKKAIEKQKHIVSDERQRASKEICRAAFPRYKEIIKKLAQNLIEASLAAEEERNFWNALEGEISTANLPVGIYAKLQASQLERHDAIQAWWFRDMVEAGYLEPGDAPKRLREAWDLDRVNVKNHL